jgi:hypothetical protein
MPTKTSSGAEPLSLGKARNCVLINQLATPGLGSLMAGRRLAGTGQLLLAVAGFAMATGWFLLVLTSTYNTLVNDMPTKTPVWLGVAGAMVFLVSWLWALVTSLQLLRSAKGSSPLELPPRL